MVCTTSPLKFTMLHKTGIRDLLEKNKYAKCVIESLPFVYL